MHIPLQFVFIKALFILVESMHPFIVDGDNAKITSHPHALYLSIQCKPNKHETSGKWVCGASILTHEVGLTAAHCLNACSKYSEVTISAGHIIPLKGVVTSAFNFTVHPDFVEGDENDGYDIALVRFKKPLKFSSKIKRVALMEKLQTPKEGHVAGWGVMQETPNEVMADRLKEVKQNLLTRTKCKELLFKLPKGTICGRNEKLYPAAGDSGNALIVKGYIQIGIVAYRLPVMPKVTVYMDVRYYYKWIQTQLYTIMCS